MKHFFSFSLLAFLAIFITGCSLKLSNIEASLPSLSGKADGVYRGEYSLSPTPVKVVLDVTIQNGRMVKIDIVKHTASPIGKPAEKIIPEIIERQSLDVDAVSGATASSKSILKAVENALQ